MVFSVLFYNYIVLQRGSQVSWGDFSEKENLNSLHRDESLTMKEPLIMTFRSFQSITEYSLKRGREVLKWFP